MWNVQYLLHLALFWSNVELGHFQAPTQADATTAVNNARSAAVPLATKMTCLTWSTTLATTVFGNAATCTIPTTNNAAYSVLQTAETFDQVINDWYLEIYDLFNDICLDTGTDQCANYKALMNDQANTFACTQTTCNPGTINGCPSTATGSCTYTLCMFDANVPTSTPYSSSQLVTSSCSNQTCLQASDPTKTYCDGFICCTSTATTTTSTTSTTTSTSSTTSTTTTSSTMTTTTTPSSSVFCNSNGTSWWCAKSNAAGQSVASAVAADSCFCITNQTQTQQQAESSCAAIGGFLTDIQNVYENNLIGTLLNIANNGSNATTSTITILNCPSNSTVYNGYCYTYQTAKLNWQNAENYCVTTYGGHLPSIRSTDQHNFIFNTLSSKCLNCDEYGLWVGGYDAGNPNNWRWIDGTVLATFPRVTSYGSWAPQPDYPTVQNCMTLVQYDGGWGDWYCSNAEPFVCMFQTNLTSPLSGSAFIGLQRSIMGHYWNLGSSNCVMNQVTYQNWNTAAENTASTSYIYTSSGTWMAVPPSTTNSMAVCRKDRNICGRNPCPSCDNCTATNNGTCFTCTAVNATTTTTAAPSLSANATSTTSFSYYCNSTNANTNWWCAKDHKEASSATSALSADSCFCVMNTLQTQQQAETSCNAIGGFLTDIQNANENQLMVTLVNLAVTPGTGFTSALCPQNSLYFNNSCYTYQSSPLKNWTDAEAYCQKIFSGHLPSIRSVAQQNFIFNTLSRNCSGCSIYGFWVGGSNGGNPNNWTWSDNTPLIGSGPGIPPFSVPVVTKYGGWPPQPDVPKYQNYMTLVQPDGGWGDWYGSWLEPYACQFSAATQTTLIGLQRTISGHFWNVGINCKMPLAATYQNWNNATESTNLTSYILNPDGTWSAVLPSTTAAISVCRVDRNICGRNPCPGCTCTPLNNGTCYSCSQSTTSSVLCTVNGTTNWWCAKDHAEGQAVASAVAADSCFCVLNATQTQQQAATSCAGIGGFLSDIENANENTLIGQIYNMSGLAGQTSSSMCPSNSKYYNGSCYFYNPSLYKGWKDAQTYCQTTYNGFLATISSVQQQQYLFQNVCSSCQGCSIFGLWVGGNDNGNASKWVWTDGSMITQFPRVTSYKGWGQQPDAPTIQQCMTLVQPDGGWGDWYCSYAEPFICQVSLASTLAWIGLQKTLSGHAWNIGTNCQTRPVSYQGWNSATEDNSKTAYAYATAGTTAGTWPNMYPTSTTSAAICRLDRNICGRNNGCSSCATCTATNNGTCFSCGASANSTNVTANATATTTTSFTYACGNTSASTQWWCAKQRTEGQAVPTALQADSCFCVMAKSQNQQQAYTACSSIGGFLTDIQNVAENNLIGTLVNISMSGSTNTSSSSCPGGTYYNGMCYVYNPYSFKTWQNAESYCQSVYGGHLASIHSVAQQQFLFTNVSKKCLGCGIYGFWIGGNDHGNPANWTWSDNSLMSPLPVVTTYKGWSAQPDAPKVQQCMTIVKPDGGWGDWYCNYPEPFMCQFPPLVTSAWIGLQRTLTGHSWNVGTNCVTNVATYQNWNSATESITNTVYTFGTNGIWSATVPSTLATNAVCRFDRNICGRNPCPSCSNCTATNSNTCYTCS